MAAWLSEVYSTIAGSPIDVEISPEMRAVFDRLASRNVEPDAAPDKVSTPAGSMYTSDGSPLPDAIPFTPKNLESIANEPDPAAAMDKLAGVLRGKLEEQSVVPPEPEIPDSEGWNPEGLFSLQERSSLEEAERFGLETEWKQARRTFGDLWQSVVNAEASYRGDRSAGSDKLDALVAARDLERILTDKDVALLTHEGLRRKMAVQRTLNRLTETTVRGDSEAVKTAETAHREALAAYQALQNVAAGARTASGRALNAWKYALQEDFSYATLYTRHLAGINASRKQQDLPPLTEPPASEQAALRDYAAKQAARVAELEALRAQLEADSTGQASQISEQQALIEKLRAELKSSTKKSVVKDTTKKRIVARVSRAAAEARERLAAAKEINLEGGTTVLFQAANPEKDALWNDRILVMAESLFAEPDMSEARFSELVKLRFGTAVAAGAADLRRDTEAHLRDTTEDVTGVHVATPDEVMGEVGDVAAVTREVVVALARAHIYEGARNSEVIDRVHETLYDSFPSITRSQVAQLFTRYGERDPKNSDELAQALRTARSLELVQKQIEDLEARGVMERTGRTRETVEIELRKLRKKRDDLSKDLGYVPVDPETQLSSPQTAAKRRMENEIEELAAAIKSGKPRVRVRRGVEYTEDLKELRGKLEDLRKTYEDTFGTERTPAEIDALLLKDLDRRIAKEESLIKRGLLAEPDPLKPAHVASPEVVARRKKLADLRQQKRDVYERANPGKTALIQATDAAEKAVARRQKILADGVPASKPAKERGEGVTPTAELTALWEAADAMDGVIREIRRARPLTPAQHQARLDAAYDQALETREALRERIRTGDIVPVVKPARQTEARTEAVRRETAILRKQMAQMQRDSGVGPFDPTVREAKRVAGLEKRLAELRRMRDDQDFAKKERTKPVTSERIRELEMDIYLAKHDFETDRAKHIYGTLGTSAKIRAKMGALWQARMMMNLTGDFGVIDRQLGKVNPFIAAQDLKQMWAKFRAGEKTRLTETMVGDILAKAYRSFMKETDHVALFRAMSTDPRYPYFKELGLDLLNPHDTSHELNADGEVRLNPLTAMSDRFLATLMIGKGLVKLAAGMSTGNLAGGIGKGIAQTALGVAVAVGGRRVALRVERANTTILNVARWHLLEAALKIPGAVDPSTSPDYARDVAIAIMNLSGKTAGTGQTSQFVRNNAFVIGQFISFPQYRWTNLQSVFMGPLARIGFGRKKAKRQAAKAVGTLYGYWAAGFALKLTVAALLLGVWDDEEEGNETWGFGVVLNPKNPNFGTLKVGRTYIDFASGARVWLSDFAQMIQHETLDRELLKYGYAEAIPSTPNTRQIAFNNFLNKVVNPNLRTVKDGLFIRKFREGGDLTRMNALNQIDVFADEILMNLTVKEFEKIMEAHGPVEGSKIFAYLMVGNNVNIKEGPAEEIKRKAEESKKYIR